MYHVYQEIHSGILWAAGAELTDDVRWIPDLNITKTEVTQCSKCGQTNLRGPTNVFPECSWKAIDALGIRNVCCYLRLYPAHVMKLNHIA